MSESVTDIIVFSPKNFFPEGSYWHVECSFHNCVENISPDDQKIFAQCPQKIKNYTFSKKRFFPKLIMCIRNLHFWNSHEKLFDKRLKYCSLNVRTRWENIYLKTTRQMFLWLRRLHFWRVYHFFGRMPKYLRKVSETEKNSN